MATRTVRWAVTGAIVVATAGAVTAGTVLTANADPALPPRTAAELLVDLQNAEVEGFSGTVVQSSDLGLPELPTGGGQGSSSLSSLVTGTHTLRVWYAGEDRARLALLGTLGESDVIRNGDDVWIWSSEENTATHYTIPDTPARADEPRELPEGAPTTPADAAEAALAALDPTTEVTTSGTATVAGRDAYELVLSPKDTESLIGSVRLAVDAETSLPLRVQIFAAGAGEPAFEVGFTRVDLTVPDAETFAFNPPPGATVTEGGTQEKPEGTPERARPEDGPAAPTVVGEGWTSVVVARAGALPIGGAPSDTPAPGEGDSGADGDAAEGFGADAGQGLALLESLPQVSGDWGSGRLLSSALVSVLLTDDGRILAGAVSPERLYEVAEQTR